MAMKDIEEGYALALASNTEPYWWRINLESGETLGMGTYGGSEALSYIILMGTAGFSSYMFSRSVKNCDETFPNNKDMADCCIVGNLVVTYGAAGISGAGGGVLSYFSEALWSTGIGALSSVLLDVGLFYGAGSFLNKVCK